MIAPPPPVLHPPDQPFTVECAACGHVDRTMLRPGVIATMFCLKCGFNFEFDTRIRQRIRPSGYQGAVTHADPTSFANRMRRYKRLFGDRK
jgi:Zn ribbon nucleic-acid-binding protein